MSGMSVALGTDGAGILIMKMKDLDSLYVCALEEEARGNEKEYLDIIFKLAEKGHSESQLELASIYTAGFYSVERNIDTALKWHLAAVDSGSPENYYCLGMIFEPGFTGPNKTFSGDRAKSRDYYASSLQGFKERAFEGDASAIFRVGEMYSMGLGVDVDEVEAKVWFDKYHEAKGKYE